MRKVPIQIRVDAADLEQWQRKASGEGKNLSEWIRERCNQNGETVRAVGTVPVGGRRADEFERPAEAPVPAPLCVAESMADTGRTKKAVPCCVHGVAKGWSCWQCRGIAVINAHD